MSSSGGQQGFSRAQQEALQRQEHYATGSSRQQAAADIERQKDKQAGQKPLRKNARVEAYNSLRPAEGRLTMEQQYQASRQEPQPEHPPDHYPRPLPQLPREDRNTAAYATREKQRESSQRILQGFYTGSEASSANVYTTEERQQRMDESSKYQKERETEREQRTQYFRRDG